MSYYTGATYTKSSSNFAHALNADYEQIARSERDVLRARARWIYPNNPIASGIDESILNNSIGNGIRFQSVTGNKSFDDEIEALVEEWFEKENIDATGRLDMGEMQRQIEAQRMVDGEILLQYVIRPREFFPLSIKQIEVDNLNVTAIDYKHNRYAEGLKFNRYGKVVGYVFRDILTDKPYEVSAGNIINYYKPENRASQYRGLSEYKQIITSLQEFEAFNDATIRSARARANLAYAVESEQGNIRAPTRDKDTDERLELINGVFVEYLNKGEKLKVIDPTASGTGYVDFVEQTVRRMAVGRKISYELAYKDFTKTNFSSARASLIQDHKVFSHNQELLTANFLNPTIKKFIHLMFMKGNIRSVSQAEYVLNPSAYIKPLWIVPERVWIDPLKEINAVAKEIELGITTLSEVAKSKGKDFSEIVTQRVKEREVLIKAGLVDEESAEIIKGKIA